MWFTFNSVLKGSHFFIEKRFALFYGFFLPSLFTHWRHSLYWVWLKIWIIWQFSDTLQVKKAYVIEINIHECNVSKVSVLGQNHAWFWKNGHFMIWHRTLSDLHYINNFKEKNHLFGNLHEANKYHYNINVKIYSKPNHFLDMYIAMPKMYYFCGILKQRDTLICSTL